MRVCVCRERGELTSPSDFLSRRRRLRRPCEIKQRVKRRRRTTLSRQRRRDNFARAGDKHDGRSLTLLEYSPREGIPPTVHQFIFIFLVVHAFAKAHTQSSDVCGPPTPSRIEAPLTSSDRKRDGGVRADLRCVSSTRPRSQKRRYFHFVKTGMCSPHPPPTVRPALPRSITPPFIQI